MATPTVTLRLIKRKTKSVYQLDYSINGQRFRVMVGSNKRDAELVRAKIQSDLILGKHGIPTSSAKSLSLADLIKAFLDKEKKQDQEEFPRPVQQLLHASSDILQ